MCAHLLVMEVQVFAFGHFLQIEIEDTVTLFIWQF